MKFFLSCSLSSRHTCVMKLGCTAIGELLSLFVSCWCILTCAKYVVATGHSVTYERELERLCPLRVLYGTTNEELDDLVAAGSAAARTAQVWLQDALLAPPQDDDALEPSEEERTRMHVLLSDAAAAAAEARCECHSCVCASVAASSVPNSQQSAVSCGHICHGFLQKHVPCVPSFPFLVTMRFCSVPGVLPCAVNPANSRCEWRECGLFLVASLFVSWGSCSTSAFDCSTKWRDIYFLQIKA